MTNNQPHFIISGKQYWGKNINVLLVRRGVRMLNNTLLKIAKKLLRQNYTENYFYDYLLIKDSKNLTNLT